MSTSLFQHCKENFKTSIKTNRLGNRLNGMRQCPSGGRDAHMKALCGILCCVFHSHLTELSTAVFCFSSREQRHQGWEITKCEEFKLHNCSLIVMYPDAEGAQLRVSNWNKNLFFKNEERKSNKYKEFYDFV